MTLKEITTKIEEILKDKSSVFIEGSSNKLKELVILVSQFVLKLFQFPLQLIEKEVRKKLITLLKKEAKLYALIMAILLFVFVIFFVLWVFITIAVGVYFKEHGQTYFVAIMLSIVFQIITIPIIGFVAYKSFHNLQSVKMIKKIKETLKEKNII